MFIRLAAALLVCAFAFTSFSPAQYKARRAPGFSLPDLAMEQVDLQEFRGQVVIVNIMRTTCEVCAGFSKSLAQVEERFEDKVKVLNIVNPPDNQSTVRQYLAQNNLNSTVLFDCGQAAASYLQIKPDSRTMSIKVPHYFVVDQNGRIREKYGYNDLTKGNFETEALTKIVAKYLGVSTARK